MSVRSLKARALAVVAAAAPLAAVLGVPPAGAVIPPTATVSQVPGHVTPTFITSCWKGKKDCAEVRAIVQSGNTIYAGGSWAQVKDPTTGVTSTAHPGLVAFDRLTGAVSSGFAGHSFNGLVRAIAVSADGSRIYVGGDFTGVDCHKVGGKTACTTAQHLIALSSSGALLPAFTVNGVPTINGGATDPASARGRVRALLLTPDGSTLYVGGDFSHLAGATVSQLGAISVATGTIIPTFHPTFTSTDVLPEISALAMGAASALGPETGRLYAAGHFDTVNGSGRNTLAALNPATGATDAGFFAKIKRQTSPYDPLQEGIAVTPVPAATGRAPSVLLAQGGHYNRGYRFNLTGSPLWTANPGGDAQAVVFSGNTVYFGGHFICWSTGAPIVRADCLTVPKPAGMEHRVHLAAVDLNTGKLVMSWAPLMEPDTVQPYYYGDWALMVSSSGDLYAGGLFTEVDLTDTNGVTTRYLHHEKMAVFCALGSSTCS